MSFVFRTFGLPEKSNFNLFWTGHLVDLTKDNFLVANSKLVIVDWLDVVCDFCKQQELTMIVKLVINSFVFASEKLDLHRNEISLGVLSLELFRSAQFFEIIPVREIFLRNFLEELFRLLKEAKIDNILHTVGYEPLLNRIMRINPNEDMVSSSEFWHSIYSHFNPPEINLNPGLRFPFRQLTAFFKLLHLFPNDYFTKSEKDAILAVAFLLEKMTSSFLKFYDSKEIIEYLDFVLVCRNLTFKIMRSWNRGGVLLHYPGFAIWWMTSIVDYRCRIKAEILLTAHIKITGEVISMTSRNFLSQSREGDSRSKLAYWNGLIKFFNTLPASLTDSSKWLSTDKLIESNNDTALEFLSYFLEACVDHLEGNKHLRMPNYQISTNEMTILNSLSELCDAVQQDLVVVLALFLDDVSQQLYQEAAKPKVIMSKFSLFKNVLRIYSSLLRYHRVLDTLSLDNNISMFAMIELLPRFLALPVPLLRVAFCNVEDNSDERALAKDSEIFGACTAIVSLALEFLTSEFFPNFEPPITLDSVIKVFALFYTMLNIIQEKDKDRIFSGKLEILFGNFIQKLSRDQYCALSENLLRKLDEISCSSPPKAAKVSVILSTLEIILQYSKQEQCQRLRRDLARILNRLCTIGQRTNSVELRIRMLDILAFMVAKKDFSFRSNDISLILSLIITFTASHSSQAQDYFESTYYLLLNIARYRREQLLKTIPTFIIILQRMLRCFVTSPHSKSPESSPLYSRSLSVSCAENFTRLLMVIGQRTTIPNRHKPVASNKIFSKYVPHLLAEYIKVQIEGGCERAIRDALKNGVYVLMDLCGEYERDMIMVGLNKVGKATFKELWAEYVKNWKYVGRG